MKIKKKIKLFWQLGGLLLFFGVIFVGVSQVGIVQLLFPRAGGVAADIVVDTQAILGPMPRPWRYLAQGGEEAEPMLDDVTPLVAGLKPAYIRIDHIYDFYEVVGRDSQGKLTFDWSRLDRVVDSILKTGAKPFLSLSYMPPAISSGDIVAPPNDYSEWSQVVSRTVSHFSGRGNRNIANVYYEVWNEPDLFGGYKAGSYVSLYSSAVSGALAAQNTQPFKIGGPATTGLYKAWFDSLLKASVENNLRLDFFSWHRYSTDLGQFWKDAEEARAWLQNYPQRLFDLELLITEWGHNSENDGGYDGVYGAAHTMAAAIEMVGRVDKAFVFEIKDGPDPKGQKYWGRWGLITHESKGLTPKPRYQALKLLNQLAINRLSLAGKGTWVKGLAAKDGETTQVLLVNFDKRGKHTENVPVTFTNLSKRKFSLTKTFLNGQSTTEEVATTAAELRREILLQPLSAVMLRLTPKE